MATSPNDPNRRPTSQNDQGDDPETPLDTLTGYVRGATEFIEHPLRVLPEGWGVRIGPWQSNHPEETTAKF